VYVSSSGGKVEAAGTLSLVPGDSVSEVQGTIAWKRQEQKKAALYPNGFASHDATVIGSRYRAPTNRTDRVLNATNLVLDFSGGTLCFMCRPPRRLVPTIKSQIPAAIGWH
jgi:hypothetical protein